MKTRSLLLLGGFSLLSPDGRDIALPTRKDRLLLSYLALPAGVPQPREKLAGLLWADRGEEQARGSLRQSLAGIRDALNGDGDDPLATARDTVMLDPSLLDIDVLAFQRAAVETGSAQRALSLYRGEFLAGIDAPTAEASQWLAIERQRLDNLAVDVVGQLSRASPDEQYARATIELGRKLLARDPLREPLYRALMRLLVQGGEKAEALKLFTACRTALKQELGIEPDLETEQLYRDILTDKSTMPAVPHMTAATMENDGRPSLAVMPFTNIAGNAGLNPLCDGLTEDIITGLGRFKLLFVIDRHSSSVVSTLTSETAEIAKRLGVSFVVHGSLQKLAQRIRITVRLVSPSNRSQMWANTFDCEMEDVLNVPEQVTMAIVNMLHARVEHTLTEQSRRKPALAAYDLLLRGIKHLRSYGPDDNQRAIDLFQQAIDSDPDYARALAYRGFADVVAFGYDSTPRHILERSRAMAEEAVRMDPDDPRCHWILGMILGYLGDPNGEARQFVRALALNPNDANIRATYGVSLVILGQVEEGLERIREAMRLNPYHPEWYWIDLGSALYIARRYEEALEAYRRKSSPGIWVLCRMAACHAQLGNTDEAKQTVAQILHLKPDFRFSNQRGGGWGPTDTAHFRDGMKKAGIPE